MKRFRLRAKHKALVVVASLAAATGVVYGCIPAPDTSGLPGYDAGPSPVFDANIQTTYDAGEDGSVVPQDSGGVDSGEDAGPGTGTIVGVVIDYQQGNGQGVIPGATVSVIGGPTTTTDAFGTFTLPNVTAGTVLLSVSNATDTTNDIAYSSTQLVVTLGGGQTVSAFPALHEGCVEIVNMADVEGTQSVNFNDGKIECPYGSTRSASYAGLAFGATSFTDPATAGGSPFTGSARIEMIPISFPNLGDSTDYTWAFGLPGLSTPPGLVGAVQIRVYDNGTGDALAVRSGDNVAATIATSQSLSADAGANNLQLLSYSSATGTWGAVTGASAPIGGTVTIDETPFDVGTSLTVPTLSGSWLALANPAAPTTCVTGTVDLPAALGGAAAAGVLVHGASGSYPASGTGVTNGSGTFCLDIAAPVGDAGTQPSVTILAAALGGGVSMGTEGSANLTTSGGSCANPSTCTNIGAAIQLSVLNGGCLSGTITGSGACPLPATLTVNLVGLEVASGQTAAGVRQEAYVGSITPADGGAFCAPAVPGNSIALFGAGVNPNNPGCDANLGITSTGGSVVSCSTSGGSACQNVGMTQLSAP